MKKIKNKRKCKYQTVLFNFYNLNNQTQNWIIDEIDNNTYIQRLQNYYNSDDKDIIKQYLKNAVKNKIEIDNLVLNLKLESELDLHKFIVKLYPNFYNKKGIKILCKKFNNKKKKE